MKRNLHIFICFIVSFHLMGQTNTIKVIKPKSDPSSDTINIVGQWVRIYDKMPNGRILKIDTNEIDTLYFTTGNKMSRKRPGLAIYGEWKLDQQKRELNYLNCVYDKQDHRETVIQISNGIKRYLPPNPEYYKIWKSTSDTLVLTYHYAEERIMRKYYLRTTK